MEDLIEMESEGTDMNELVDLTLPNDLGFEDLPIGKEELQTYEERLPLGHTHHRDGNRELAS